MPDHRKTSTETRFRYLLLLSIHIVVAFSVFGLFYAIKQYGYLSWDAACFRMLNGLIADSSFWQNFWALANHRGADWLQDGVFLFFFFLAIKTSPREKRVRKTAECLFFLLFGIAIILLANELLFRVLIHVKRNSPTLVFDTFVNLSEKITWLKVKFKSPKSFPGDHATTAITFLIAFFYLARHNLPLRIASTGYGIFLCLPRLVAGAHWPSDILIGSGSIVALFFGWAFCTPFAERAFNGLETFLNTIVNKRRVDRLKG